MSKFKFASLLLIFVLGITMVSAQETGTNVAITLERTACFGACPVYTVSILENGTVIYNGGDFVEVTGEQTTEMSPETVEQMVEAFANAGYFEWDEAYMAQNITDLPTVITSVTRNGETHRIERYAGDYTAPLALPFLENWIDIMANTSLWTGVQHDSAAISNGTDTPFITLEQTACFGFCPVYSVAVFEDGTVVYTGSANVSEIGVHVIAMDALEVTSIAQRAQSLGYFDWQDSYEQQIMTDQVNVITSIRWENQFKRIVRYDGDPNAPVGLVWVEEMIELLVTDLVE